MRIWVQISTYIKAKHGCTCLWPQYWRMEIGRLWELVASWAPRSVSQRNRIDICRRQPVFSSGLHVCVHSHTCGWTVTKKERKKAKPYCSSHQRSCVGGLWSLLCPMAVLAHDYLSGCPHTGLFTHRLIPLPGILPCPLLQPEGFLHRLGELAGRQEVQNALFHQWAALFSEEAD